MKFVDLYAGAGGWALGLSLAGHSPVFSGEIWSAANTARNWNMGTEDGRVDVRALDPDEVPDCDLLVGSPPCTQFSYANRGGNGDLADGLADIRAFLRVVRAKNPRFWAMENVPRLCGILQKELAPGGELVEFSDLFESIDEFDMSEWGVPQRRRRCIAGRYPREALMALRGRITAPSLGAVIEGCRTGFDPVWKIRHDGVTDNDRFETLSWEEGRINLEKKRNHPIYNDMAFPDDPARTARTITATCTKVSRESIVVSTGTGHRLLSVRESAAIQSFPLSYQFPAASQSDRIKMAGNAIPPLFTYLLGLAVAGREFSLPEVVFAPEKGMAPAASYTPRKSGRKVSSRSFRAAISSLRFKSAMSFELRNIETPNTPTTWEIVLNLGKFGAGHLALSGSRLATLLPVSDSCLPIGPAILNRMQDSWLASRDDDAHPYRVADVLSKVASEMADGLSEERASATVLAIFTAAGSVPSDKAMRLKKQITAGLIVATCFNRLNGVPALADVA